MLSLRENSDPIGRKELLFLPNMQARHVLSVHTDSLLWTTDVVKDAACTMVNPTSRDHTDIQKGKDHVVRVGSSSDLLI